LHIKFLNIYDTHITNYNPIKARNHLFNTPALYLQVKNIEIPSNQTKETIETQNTKDKKIT